MTTYDIKKKKLEKTGDIKTIIFISARKPTKKVKEKRRKKENTSNSI